MLTHFLSRFSFEQAACFIALAVVCVPLAAGFGVQHWRDNRKGD